MANIQKDNKFLNTVRTVYGIKLSTALTMGLNYKTIPFTTLNEKLGIYREESLNLSPRTYPQTRYMCIGDKGHKNIKLQPHDVETVVPIQHLATDASLKRLIPFVMRKLGEDLTDVEKEKYGLRRKEVFNGEEYWCYYLRRIPTNTTNIEMAHVTIDQDGNRLTTPFTPTRENLDPELNDYSYKGTNTIKAEYIESYAILDLSFDADELKELRNVALIRYGDVRAAIISEIGLVAGIDNKIEYIRDDGSNGSMREVLGATLCNIAATFHSAYFQNEYVEIKIAIGNGVPLWKHENPDKNRIP